jgi:hypothetical protein
VIVTFCRLVELLDNVERGVLAKRMRMSAMRFMRARAHDFGTAPLSRCDAVHANVVAPIKQRLRNHAAVTLYE